MKALLFEWLTGGGLWLDSTPLDSAGPMLRQGSAMVSAVGLDLAKFAEVDLLIDSRLNQPKAPVSSAIAETAATLNGLTQLAQVHSVDSDAALKSKLQSLAADADAILLIAPETDDCLADSIRWLGPDQHKLISPSLDFVVATSNKNQLAERLTQQGFDALPQGTDLARGGVFRDCGRARYLVDAKLSNTTSRFSHRAIRFGNPGKYCGGLPAGQ